MKIYKLKRFIVKSEIIHAHGFEKFIWDIIKWILVVLSVVVFCQSSFTWPINGDMTMGKIVGYIFVLLLALSIYLFCIFYWIIDVLKIYFSIRSISYTHKQFCKFIKFFRKDKKKLSKWQTYPMYIFSLLFWCIFLFTIIIMVSSIKNKNEKYPSDKYKKVIKKGIFWDSIEYHERCCIQE